MNSRIDISRLKRLALIITSSALLATVGVVQASGFVVKNGKSPAELGKFGVGYTEHLLCDADRAIDVPAASFPVGHPIRECVLSEDENAQQMSRPVYLRIWYPSKAKHGELAHYSWDNPVYEEIITGYDYDSEFARRDAPIKRGKHAVVINSPGYGAPGVTSDANELLASHGMIVIAIDHTNSVDNAKVDSNVGYEGPFPILPTDGELLTLRAGDVSFLLDELESGLRTDAVNFKKHVKKNRIGAYGDSYGSPTLIALAGGVESLGIEPDPRLKAIAGVDGTIYNQGDTGNPLVEETVNIRIPMMLMSTNVANDSIVALKNNSSIKEYFVNIQAADHIPSLLDLCRLWDINLAAIESGTVTGLQMDVIEARFVDEIYKYCPSALTEKYNNPSYPTIESMPMLMTQEELLRIKNQYLVAFMMTHVVKTSRFKHILTPKYAEKNEPLLTVTTKEPFVEQKGNPFDLVPGSKITFEPVGDTHYRVSYSTGASLDPALGEDLVGFAAAIGFPSPDNAGDVDSVLWADPIYSDASDPFAPDPNRVFSLLGEPAHGFFYVGSDGFMTVGVQDLDNFPSQPAFDLNFTLSTDQYGLLNAGKGIVKLAPYLSDLRPGIIVDGENQGKWYINWIIDGRGYGDFFDFVPAEGPARIISTWVDVPKEQVDDPKFQYDPSVTLASTTVQVVLYIETGVIEYIYGDIDGIVSNDNTLSTRAADLTGEIATVGISLGDRVANYPNVPISDENRVEVDFTELPPEGIVLPIGAIYEHFTE